MLSQNNMKTIMFTILCICFIFYLSMGIYSYNKNNKLKSNRVFFALCISTSIWAIGYAFMLISPNMEIANIWRIVSASGWCFFNASWICFALSFKYINQKKSGSKIQALLFIASIVFFISNLLLQPSEVVGSEAYGFVDNVWTHRIIDIVFNIYIIVSFTAGLVIIYFQAIHSPKNRVRKQMKIIFTTCLISFFLTLISDFILPGLGINAFPYGIISVSIGMGGMWYAINKYKMMSISPEFVSNYIFEAINEPIFILSEDFRVKNCNEASLNITGYNYEELVRNSFDKIINFRNFNFNTIIKVGNVNKIEVDLHRKNKEALVCELSATVMYDEYEDILGIVMLLHDISERKNIAKMQREYTSKLEESNLMLKKQIADRLLAEEQIRHLIYYDALTELSNRKRMIEDINILLDNRNEKFAVLFIDLDKFKSVNDNYGHEAGDHVLKNVAVRLKDIIRSTGTISRIGGDEFIILLRVLKSTENAEEVAVAVLKELSTVFTYKANQLFIGGSIGISIFPDHGIDADMLINKADLAMYYVKNSGGCEYAIYNDSMNYNAINSLQTKL